MMVPAHLRERVSSGLSTLKPYERHISAAGMVGGFAFDNYAFGRVDHPATLLVIFAYIAAAACSIALLHRAASRGEARGPWRTIFSASTQFALGGLWSAFLVFYGRSAVLSASWPFLLLLAGMLVGNEVFRAYHSRLVFTTLLFFFALFSYATFALPILTRTIGTGTFLMSGVISVGAFAGYLLLLDRLGPSRFRQAARAIALGAVAVFAGLNLFYFASLLPPLPLALADAGVYHSVKRQGEVYVAQGEPQRGFFGLGPAPTVHLAKGEPLYFYSAVFAPIALTTRLVHRWQRYDGTRWSDESTVSFPIRGGRENGYRAYSIKSSPRPGRWRVDIRLMDGRLIGRTVFNVESGAASAPTQMKVLH